MKTQEIFPLENNTGVLMEVSNYADFSIIHKRFIIAKIKGGRYLAWADATTEEDIDYTCTCSWKYVRPINSVPEYTMAELTAKLGHEFKIKK